MQLNENIIRLRRARGLTQEDLARALGVSNQAVSKWESGLNCPDIQLLPALAEFFSVSTDELLGVERKAAMEDSVPQLRKALDALPKEERYAFGFGLAAVLHASLLGYGFPPEENNVPDMLADSALEKARQGKWGYSCLCEDRIATVMRGGAVFFSNLKGFDLDVSEVRRLGMLLRDFSAENALPVAVSLLKLTAAGAEEFVTARRIAEDCGLTEEQAAQALGRLAPYLERRERNGEILWRFEEKNLCIVPVLSLLAMH